MRDKNRHRLESAQEVYLGLAGKVEIYVLNNVKATVIFFKIIYFSDYMSNS